MSEQPCDVLVIGGGPAGATVAARLAQLGHHVVLVDRGRSSERVETLAPGTVELLELTGARAAVDAAGFEPVATSAVDWGRGVRSRAAAGTGLLVDRARFDALLLDAAEVAGVEVVRGGVAGRREHPDAPVAVRTAAGGRRAVRAGFVVDAAGRRRAGGTVTAPPTLALSARVVGPVPSVPSVHARPDAWFWCAPAPGGCQVTAFVDPGVPGPAADRFRSLVEGARLFPAGSWRIAGRTRAADATPTIAEGVAGPGHLRVGDAAVALDPLSSTGVQKAVQSALAAAVVVNTVLRRPADADAALDHHRRAVAAGSQHHAVWAAETYAEGASVFGTPFWTARAAAARPADDAAPERIEPPHPDLLVRLSTATSVVETTRLEGDFVTRGPAVVHPGLDGEVAFLGGVALVPLLARVTGPVRLADLVDAWSGEAGPRSAARAAGWLYRRGVLERTEPASGEVDAA